MNAEFHHCTCDSTPYLFRGLLATLPDGVIERPGEEVGRGVSEAAGELLRELDSGHGLVAVIVGDERLQARAAVVRAAAIENGMRDKCIDRGKNLPPRSSDSPCTGPAAEDVIVVHNVVVGVFELVVRVHHDDVPALFTEIFRAVSSCISRLFTAWCRRKGAKLSEFSLSIYHFGRLPVSQFARQQRRWEIQIGRLVFGTKIVHDAKIVFGYYLNEIMINV